VGNWATGAKPTPADLALGHYHVFNICAESSDSKSAEQETYLLFVNAVKEVFEAFGAAEAGKILSVMFVVFKYLDQHYTDTQPRAAAVVTKEPTSTLCPGQALREVVKQLIVDRSWTPDYYGSAPSAADSQAETNDEVKQHEQIEAAMALRIELENGDDTTDHTKLNQSELAELERTASAPVALARATSFNTLNNIADLACWLPEKALLWTKGEAVTPAEVSEGHALVYKICTGSSQPKDAENQCYMLFLDYVRGICGQFVGRDRKTALQALRSVFKYLDQHFTNVQNRQGMTRSKLPTSKLCAGQDLKTAAKAIEADPLWIPDYQVMPAPAAPAPAPAPAASLGRQESAPVTLKRAASARTQANLDQLLDWVTHSLKSWMDGHLATPAELAQGHFLVYTVCCESSESSIKGGEARCYGLYVQSVRDVLGSSLQQKNIGAVLLQLQKVFRYLDQHYTDTRSRAAAQVCKEPTSKLCPGQGLREVEAKITLDPVWTPDYYAA